MTHVQSAGQPQLIEIKTIQDSRWVEDLYPG